MSADIFVYAIVAAGLVFWLRNILGERHEDEPQRPNPYMRSPEATMKASNEASGLDDNSSKSQEDLIAELRESGDKVLSVENKGAENGLNDIVGADKSFDVRLFLENAQDAFVMIVESFAAGDRDVLKDMLAEPVYKAFDQAITEREETDQTQETEIRAIRRAEIIEAHIDKDRTANVTVRFAADEVSVTKDKGGDIINGHPNKTTEMNDIWVFARNVRSRDPRWFLQETRGGFEGDNDLLPNSDE